MSFDDYKTEFKLKTFLELNAERRGVVTLAEGLRFIGREKPAMELREFVNDYFDQEEVPSNVILDLDDPMIRVIGR